MSQYFRSSPSGLRITPCGVHACTTRATPHPKWSSALASGPPASGTRQQGLGDWSKCIIVCINCGLLVPFPHTHSSAFSSQQAMRCWARWRALSTTLDAPVDNLRNTTHPPVTFRLPSIPRTLFAVSVFSVFSPPSMCTPYFFHKDDLRPVFFFCRFTTNLHQSGPPARSCLQP